MMAVRVTGRTRVLVSRTVHPEYREVLRTYSQHQGMPVDEFGYVDGEALRCCRTSNRSSTATCGVIIQSPNFFGIVEDVKQAAAIGPQAWRAAGGRVH